MKNKIHKSWKPYLANFILTSLIFIIIASIMDFVPFGENSMLTIDLGQQYIDFFSLYKNTLTNDPDMLLYSFQKALGGEMIGLWAYYLMSPYNIIFLVLPREYFTLGVTIISYLKILSASMTMLYYLRHKYQLKATENLFFTLSYAFMGYMVVYLLNIMWLDAVVFLPIIALGLERLMKGEGRKTYVLSLALTLISNYYIGYMVCLFLVFYAIYSAIEVLNEDSNLTFKNFTRLYGRFIMHSVLAALIAACVLIPTLFSILKTSKGDATELIWEWEPAHTNAEILAKLIFGSFKWDEIKASAPNLYVGALPLVFLVHYYTNPKIKKSEKFASLLVYLVFLLSYRYDFLNKIWHGGKFPIWYHYRFSFTNSFFTLVLAARSYAKRPRRASSWSLLVSIAFFSIMGLYYLKNPVEYQEPINIMIWLVIGLLVVFLQTDNFNFQWKNIVLLTLVVVDVTGNAVVCISEFNYVKNSKFADYTNTLEEAVSGIKAKDDEFYRIHKTYSRTKNEAMYAGYYGLDHFGSTIEEATTNLYGYLGLPNSSGTATYTNGTIFTDDLFAVRYLLEPTKDTDIYTDEDGYVLYPHTTDLDNQMYPLIDAKARYQTRENSDHFSLAIEVSPDIIDTEFKEHLPVENQEKLLQLIDFKGNGESYFKEVPLDEITYTNINITDKGEYGDYFTYVNVADEDAGEEAYFEIKFTTDPNKLYYFTIPSQYNKDDLKMELNEEEYRFYTPFQKRQITNASYLTGGEQTLRVKLKTDEFQANQVKLYSFDYERYNEMVKSKNDNNFEITKFKSSHIKGEIDCDLDKGYLLFTLPYDNDWQIKVDSQKVSSVAVLSDTLMAVPVTKGHHTIEMKYRPKSVYIGGVVSFIGLVALFIVDKRKIKDLQ